MTLTFGKDIDYILGWARDKLVGFASEVVGDIGETANAIIDVWEIDCEGEWVLYLKTGTIAAGHGLYLLLVPSLEEIIESYLEPKAGRRGGRRGARGERERRRNRIGQRRVYFRGGFPDIDNAIANKIPGRNFLAGRRIGPGKFLFWTGVRVGDFVLWYWLIVQATNTFATKWISGLIESGQCNALNSGSCQFRVGPRTSFTQDPLWFASTTLIGLSTTNMEVGNNGSIDLPISVTRAGYIVIIETTWRLETGPIEGITIEEVGSSAQSNTPGSSPTGIKTQTSQLSAPQNSTAVRLVSQVVFFNDANDLSLRQERTLIQSVGAHTLTMTARVSCASRNLYSV